MPETPIFTLSCSPCFRTNGDVVSGTIHLNLRLAHEKNIEAVRVSLRGEVHAYVLAVSSPHFERDSYLTSPIPKPYSE